MGETQRGVNWQLKPIFPPHPTLSHQGRGLFGGDSVIKKIFFKNRRRVNND
jgi:hypothetical protein